ncbi:MAG TPA: TlpA disulfide reductase family protein [Kofleriaceae bacterium]|nr:TlpA disulfide reductase family protein [Kofleriaceae bacterium]
MITLAAAAATTAACETKTQGEGGDPPARANTAKTATRQGTTAEAFCDAHFPAGKGPALKWPEMAPTAAGGAAPLVLPSAGWRWINVWATWCKPCVEEMPRLRTWRDKLGAAGKPFELAFVSIDESDAVVAEFQKAHPDMPPSVRLAEPDKSLPWFRELGLTGEPPIPVHVFVDPTSHVRCARAGAVREKDYDTIVQLLGS